MLGCAAITLIANFQYGLHVAAGPERWVFAIGGSFLDGLKTLLPIALGTVLANRITAGSFARLSVGTLLWLGCLTWSLFCAMQMYEMTRAERVGSTEAGKVSYRQHQEIKAKTESRIGELSRLRSIEIVEGELGAARHDKLWSRSKECTDATAAESREFCKMVATLTSEKATALTAAEIKADLERQRAKLAKAEQGMEGTNLSEVLIASDPGTEGLAKALGIDVETARYRLALFFAILLELGGSLSGWVTTGGHLPAPAARRKDEPEPQEEPEILAPPSAPPIEEAPEVLKEPEPKPLTPVALWATECIVPRKGTFTPSREVRDGFNAWAAINGHSPLNATAFGKEMTARGFHRDRRGGVQIYVDMALVQKPKPGLRVVASN